MPLFHGSTLLFAVKSTTPPYNLLCVSFKHRSLYISPSIQFIYLGGGGSPKAEGW